MRFNRLSLIAGIVCVASAARGQQAPLLSPSPGPAATAASTQSVGSSSGPAIPATQIAPPTTPTAATPAPVAASATTTSKPETSAALSKFLTEPLPTPAAGDKAGGVVDDAKKDSDAVLGEEPSWYERTFLLVPAPWDTGIELGLNGSAGTSDSFSMRTGGYMKRESRFSRLDLSTYYNRTDSGGKITQNNAQFDVRNDWLLDEKSPWTLFAQNSVFYDQFKDFNVQTNVDTGIGYRFFHEKTLELIGRVGGGTSREFGGEDTRWVPEGLIGIEYSQQISQTQKIYGKLDYFPELDQVSDYRAVADTGWEVVLVQPSNLSLKICATDRYDSTPTGGAEPHLINYSVMLLMKL